MDEALVFRDTEPRALRPDVANGPEEVTLLEAPLWAQVVSSGQGRNRARRRVRTTEMRLIFLNIPKD